MLLSLRALNLWFMLLLFRLFNLRLSPLLILRSPRLGLFHLLFFLLLLYLLLILLLPLMP